MATTDPEERAREASRVMRGFETDVATAAGVANAAEAPHARRGNSSNAFSRSIAA